MSLVDAKPTDGFYKRQGKLQYRILVQLSDEEREMLAKLTHRRSASASEVLRQLIREATEAP